RVRTNSEDKDFNTLINLLDESIFNNRLIGPFEYIYDHGLVWTLKIRRMEVVQQIGINIYSFD
ncbi:MAG: hypothetical protein P1P88_24325, partial [Bacteroidales bacterium]|nr:hypothetical protein [Bacteroidales bacterium]